MRIATAVNENATSALRESNQFEIIGYFRCNHMRFTYILESEDHQEAILDLIHSTKGIPRDEIARSMEEHDISLLRLASWEGIEIVSLRVLSKELLHRIDHPLPESFGDIQDVEGLLKRAIRLLDEAGEKLEIADGIVDRASREEAEERAWRSGRADDVQEQDYTFAGPTRDRLRRFVSTIQSTVASRKKEL